MMRMEVEIISRETIRPSSPTPPHLRTFKLSILDQISPMLYVPVIFFYSLSDHGHLKIHNTSTTDRLKDSLSKTLTRFYPLAGRIKNDISIDCNDNGVSYFEARVSCHMSQFLKQPLIELLHQFIPVQTYCTQPITSAVQVAIQVNIFECGGIAIGVCTSHKIIDGTTMSAFLKDWAATASESYDKVVSPCFGAAASLYPPTDVLPSNTFRPPQSSLKAAGKKSVTRRFVFDAAAIAALKANAISEHVPHPTRVEALSGFVWKCAMAASSVVSGSPRPSILTHAVNMRPRMVPPLSEYSVGNITWMVTANCNMGESEIGLHGLVGLLKQVFTKINSDYLKTLQGEEGFSMICEFLKERDEVYSNEKADIYAFTSWCKFGLNEVDFGWGKPIWVSLTGGPPMYMPGSKNVVVLMENRWVGNIEAWMIMEEQKMAVLECDPEFLAFASPNPSILDPVTPCLLSAIDHLLIN